MEPGSYYLEEHGFIFNKFAGKVDDVSLLRLINNINEIAGDLADLRELSDCRDIQSIEELTVEGTISSSKEEINRPRSLLAILVPEFDRQIWGMAKVYQSFSEGTRQAVEIFTDLDEAVSWLARDANEKKLLMKFIGDR